MLPAIRPTHVPRRRDEYRRARLWRGETLWEAFEATARRHDGKTAIVDGRTRIRFGALRDEATRLAAGLASLGVVPNDVVSVQLPNWHETIAVQLAAARLGAVLNPVLPGHRERELEFVLREAGTRVLVVPGRWRDHDHRDLVRAVRPCVPSLREVVVVRDEPAAGMHAYGALAGPDAPPAHDPEAVALLLYTSGSTAEPKGVLHSHETLLAEARSLGPVHGLGPADTTLVPSPLAHVSGIVHGLLVPSVFGTSAVLMERWDPGAALALVAAEAVTYMVGAPTLLRDLAGHPDLPRYDTRSFRLFSCGGADVDPALVRDAAARLGCVAKRVYGSSEFPTITTTGPDDPPARRIDGEGRPIGAAEIRLVDEHGIEVARGSEGEILACGPECFLGYRDDRLNVEAFTDDGWFRTGDLGVVDADGYLRITGRKKDIIIRKGENISAREVEELAATHPAVAEVAVIGVPDAAAGEIACAVLRLRAGATAPGLAELAAHLRAQGLAKQKLPERLEIVPDFPRTAAGKIAKRELRKAYAG